MDSVQEVIGNYKIVSRVGKGGMGAVFRAVHQTLGREVALKLLPAEFTQSAEYVTRFLREARAVANLSHPNVVGVHDAGDDNGQYFIAMEMVNGAPLSAICRKKGPLPEAVVLDFLAQSAKGLTAAHKRGLIHRDIKPENMLVNEEGVLKIVDFGLVKDAGGEASNLTRTGTFLGTPTFMSPEQCDGGVADARSDMYSIGASFYSVLVGNPPFSAPTALGILYKHKFEPPPDIQKTIPDATDEVCAILMKLLNKEREDRYQSCEELLEETEKALKTAPPKPDEWDLDDLLKSVAVKEEVPTLVPTIQQQAGSMPTMVNPQGQSAMTGGLAAPGQTPGGGYAPTIVAPAGTPGPGAQTTPGLPPQTTPAPVTPGPHTTPGPHQIVPQKPPVSPIAKIAVIAVVAIVVCVAAFFLYKQSRKQKLLNHIALIERHEESKDFVRALAELNIAERDFRGHERLDGIRDRIEDAQEKHKSEEIIQAVETRDTENDYRKLLSQAGAALKEKDFDEAAKLYEKAAPLEDKLKLERSKRIAKQGLEQCRFESAMAKGHAHLKASRFKEATASFEEASKYDTTDKAGEALDKVELEKGKAELAGFLKEKDWDKAVRAAKKLRRYGFTREQIKKYEDQAALERLRSEALTAYTEKKDFEAAAELLREAADYANTEATKKQKEELLQKADNYLVDGWTQKADAAEKKKEWGDAATFLSRALKVKKDDPNLKKRWRDALQKDKESMDLASVIQAAEAFMKSRDWGKAAAKLERALQHNPDDQKTKKLFNEAKARELAREGDLAKGIKSWDRALENYREGLRYAADLPDIQKQLRANQAAVSTKLSDIAQKEKVAKQLQTADPEKSLERYKELIILNPDKRNAYQTEITDLAETVDFKKFMALGNKQLSEGNWSEARKHFEQARTVRADASIRKLLNQVKNGQAAQEHIDQGKAAFNKKDWQAAKQAFTEASGALPEGATSVRAAVKKQLDAVLKTTKRIGELSAQAKTERNRQRWSHARTAYKELIALDPLRSGAYKKTLSEIDKLEAQAKAGPKPAEILVAARGHVKSGNFQAAKQAATKGLGAHPGSAELKSAASAIDALIGAQASTKRAETGVAGGIAVLDRTPGARSAKGQITGVIDSLKRSLASAQASFEKGKYADAQSAASRVATGAIAKARSALSSAATTCQRLAKAAAGSSSGGGGVGEEDLEDDEGDPKKARALKQAASDLSNLARQLQ